MQQLLLGLEGETHRARSSRLYLALRPPVEVMAAIADIVGACRARCGAGSWFYEPAVWHISLFKAWEGVTPHEGRARHIASQVRPLRAPSVNVTFDILGSLKGGGGQWPLVLASSTGLEDVVRLAGAIGQCLAPTRTVAPAALPHLTLGWVSHVPLEVLPNAISFRASHFALIGSGAGPWTVHAEFPLDGSEFPALPVAETPRTGDLFGPYEWQPAKNVISHQVSKSPSA